MSRILSKKSDSYLAIITLTAVRILWEVQILGYPSKIEFNGLSLAQEIRILRIKLAPSSNLSQLLRISIDPGTFLS